MKAVTVIEKAYAKLNLSLDVLARREDGFHDMLMVMQSVSLCDDVKVSVAPGGGEITVSTDRSYIPNGEKNLGFIAARAFFEACGGADADVSIVIKKNTPVRAGMGGGSSDAAAVLRAMNRAYGGRFSAEELREVAKTVGSDVPFCVEGGTALAEGRGTDFTPLKDLAGCFFVIVKPNFSVSTPVLFSKLDSVKVHARPDTEGIIRAVREGDVVNVARRCFNVFEEALSPRERAAVEAAKTALITCGALGASMTGTGSAVFGVFTARSEAERAAATLCEDYDEVWLSEPVGKCAVK